MHGNEHVIIVGGHSNSQKKKNDLISCLKSAQQVGFDIVLSSHYQEDKDAYSLANYFLYDAYDPSLTINDYYDNEVINFVFYEDSNYRIDWIPPLIHDYSVFNLIRNGVLFSREINKKYVHVVEYDCLIDKNIFIKELVDPLNQYDVSYSIWDENIKHLMAAYMFSFRMDKYEQLFIQTRSKKEIGRAHV